MLRTYNTLIIACNMCNQPREAMAVYKRMLDEGYTPNATTYNALISAHGKAGQLDKVSPCPAESLLPGEPLLLTLLFGILTLQAALARSARHLPGAAGPSSAVGPHCQGWYLKGCVHDT